MSRQVAQANRFLSGAVSPVQPPRVTLPFAAVGYGYTQENPHRGVDMSPYPGAFGEPISAAWGGTVTRTGYTEGRGNYVSIVSVFPFAVWGTDLQGNVQTVPAGQPFTVGYYHLQSAPAVRQGEVVRPGQYLGDIGATGRATGAHLHMIAWYDGDYLDPLDLLSATVVGFRQAVVYSV